jgi:hypothetical protein
VSKGRGLPGCSIPPPNPQKLKFKKQFCRYYDIKVLRDFSFSRNQPLKSAVDQYIRILKNKLIKLRKQEDRTP